ncbi:MAG: COX15/CtaA family protein [Acidobacteriota bacterium]
MTQQGFHRFAWSVLAFMLIVVVWGAFVRATGSGAGCGSHWPLCNGEIVPRAEQIETVIEFSHRLTSGVALLLVVALAVWARRAYEPGHVVRKAAYWSLFFILIEAAIGARLVLSELVADNASIERGVSMMIHLCNTFLLLGALTLTAHYAGGAKAPASWRGGRIARLFWVSVSAMMLVGATGAIAALGDTLFPPGVPGSGVGQDSQGAHIFVQLRVVHPFVAIGTSLIILALIGAIRAAKLPEPARRYANALNALVLLQIGIGSLNMVLHAPVWMQLVHLLMADSVWIALVLTGNAALLEKPATAAVPRARAAEPAPA